MAGREYCHTAGRMKICLPAQQLANGELPEDQFVGVPGSGELYYSGRAEDAEKGRIGIVF